MEGWRWKENADWHLRGRKGNSLALRFAGANPGCRISANARFLRLLITPAGDDIELEWTSRPQSMPEKELKLLDYFALIVLVVLFAAAIAIWVVLGMMPGKIARSRNHPQADAINVCGWWGVLTMGILCPLAFIWAYSRPINVVATKPKDDSGECDDASEEGAEG